MRRLEPAVELLAHDMTVSASRWIVSDIGPTFGIGKGVEADADGNADNGAKKDALNRVNRHLVSLLPLTPNPSPLTSGGRRQELGD